MISDSLLKKGYLFQAEFMAGLAFQRYLCISVKEVLCFNMPGFVEIYTFHFK